jgi:hypothetical protein
MKGMERTTRPAYWKIIQKRVANATKNKLVTFHPDNGDFFLERDSVDYTEKVR